MGGGNPRRDAGGAGWSASGNMRLCRWGRAPGAFRQRWRYWAADAGGVRARGYIVSRLPVLCFCTNRILLSLFSCCWSLASAPGAVTTTRSCLLPLWSARLESFRNRTQTAVPRSRSVVSRVPSLPGTIAHGHIPSSGLSPRRPSRQYTVLRLKLVFIGSSPANTLPCLLHRGKKEKQPGHSATCDTTSATYHRLQKKEKK